MWILTPSITSAFAAATGALTSASNEQLAAAFARSLLSRSKPSPQRTWLQRLKRDSWTTHLSGAISSDSLGESFTDWWTSSLAVTRASHSAQPASDSEPKTHDTSGRLSQPELLQCDQQYVSLKTSRDISALGYPTLSKTWADWVTERRGAWRARVSAARLTRGSGSSYWPTARTNDSVAGRPNDGKDRIGKNGERFGINLSDKVIAEQNWPSPVASEVRQGFQDRSRGMKGSQESLTTVVMKGWPTPNASDSLQGGTTQGNRKDPNLSIAVHGQAAPASPNRHGSRQGLWPTITAHTPDMESNGPNGHPGTYLAGAVKQWMTPRACEAQNPPMGVDKRHHGLTHQVKYWPTPKQQEDGRSLDAWKKHQAENKRNGSSGGPPGATLNIAIQQWATPRTPTGGPESAQRKQELGWATSGGDLASQASGKLNPRWVETLMGLPIGWTMPSCTSPVTIAPTSCDSLGMALCRPAQSERSDFLLAS